MNKKQIISFLLFLGVLFQSNSFLLAQEATKILPAESEINGWLTSEKPVFYKADDMWKQINGAQDQYLKYDCLGLTVAYYKDKNGNEVSIEIYTMADENCAFGIITEQKPAKALKKLQLGAFAYYEKDFLHFYKNYYFVKIQLFPENEMKENPLKMFARKIVEKIDGQNEIPRIFKVFPKDNRLENSFFFQRKGIGGISSLTNGFGAKYKNGEENISIIFLKISDMKGALTFEEVKQKLTRRSVGEQKPIEKKGFKGIAFEDKYKGPITLLKTEQHIFLINGLSDEDWLFGILEQLNNQLIALN